MARNNSSLFPSTSSSKFRDMERIAATTPKTSGVLESQSCAQLAELFDGVNNYFREEDILTGTEHSSILVGNVITVAYLVVIAFGAIGNLLTIAAVLRNPQMRTVRNFFIVNLALSDFFICTVTAPITLYTVLYMFWPYGMAFCKIAGSLQGFNIFLSTFSITAIALDRYVLVIFPTKRDRQHNLSLIFFSLIWLISILLALPLFVASDLKQVFKDERCGISLYICNEQNEHWQQMPITKAMYTVGVLVIQYAFPLVSIMFAYSRIAHRMGLRKLMINGANNQQQAPSHRGSIMVNGTTTLHMGNGNGVDSMRKDSVPARKTSTCPNTLLDQRKKSIADRHRRTNFLLMTLVVVFATAWLPLNIFHLVNTFSRSQNSFSVPMFALCHVVAICSACLNPVSYAFFNQNFRNEFLTIYQKLGLLWVYQRVTTSWTKRFSQNSDTRYQNGTSFRRSSLRTVRKMSKMDQPTKLLSPPIIMIPEESCHSAQITTDGQATVVMNSTVGMQSNI